MRAVRIGDHETGALPQPVVREGSFFVAPEQRAIESCKKIQLIINVDWSYSVDNARKKLKDNLSSERSHEKWRFHY